MPIIRALIVLTVLPVQTDDASASDANVKQAQLPEAEQKAAAALKKWNARVTITNGRVSEINLTGSEISDAEVELITEFSSLEHLGFSACSKISESGFVFLSALPKLKGLSLDRTNIGNAGLKHLSQMTDLSFLNLNATKITDNGLRHLSGLCRLQVLYVNGTKLGGSGLVHLKRLRNLHWLDLSGTGITDAAVVHLKPFSKLRLLSLSHTGITDAGLENLNNPALIDLSIRKTGVSAQGLKDYRRLQPNCRIDR